MTITWKVFQNWARSPLLFNCPSFFRNSQGSLPLCLLETTCNNWRRNMSHPRARTTSPTPPSTFSLILSWWIRTTFNTWNFEKWRRQSGSYPGLAGQEGHYDHCSDRGLKALNRSKERLRLLVEPEVAGGVWHCHRILLTALSLRLLLTDQALVPASYQTKGRSSWIRQADGKNMIRIWHHSKVHTG